MGTPKRYPQFDDNVIEMTQSEAVAFLEFLQDEVRANKLKVSALARVLHSYSEPVPNPKSQHSKLTDLPPEVISILDSKLGQKDRINTSRAAKSLNKIIEPAIKAEFKASPLLSLPSKALHNILKKMDDDDVAALHSTSRFAKSTVQKAMMSKMPICIINIIHAIFDLAESSVHHSFNAQRAFQCEIRLRGYNRIHLFESRFEETYTEHGAGTRSVYGIACIGSKSTFKPVHFIDVPIVDRAKETEKILLFWAAQRPEGVPDVRFKFKKQGTYTSTDFKFQLGVPFVIPSIDQRFDDIKPAVLHLTNVLESCFSGLL